MIYEGLPVVIRKQTNPVISWGHSGIAFEHAGIISGITKATAKCSFSDGKFRVSKIRNALFNSVTQKIIKK